MLCAKNRRQTDAVRMFSMFKASNYRGRGRRQGSVASGRGASGKQVRRPAVRERNGQVRHCECKKRPRTIDGQTMGQTNAARQLERGYFNDCLSLTACRYPPRVVGRG